MAIDRDHPTAPRFPARITGGMSMAIGSLPHRSPADAVALSIAATDVVTIPTLPRRSPAEDMIAQAIVGLCGVSAAQYGSIAVDAASIDITAPVRTDLDHDAFGGFRAFLQHAAEHPISAPVKWQFVGPITLGLSLQRAGLPAADAFETAIRVVRAHTAHLLDEVSNVLPQADQIVVLDEPELGALFDAGFPLAPEDAIDLLSGALSAVEPVAVAGVHCCGDMDWATMLSVGADLISVPVTNRLVDSAGYIQRFLEGGGWIAWGAVPTDGPVPMSPERPWKRLCDVWCQLVQHGCSPALLRQQSLITPECGLGMHNPGVAERVLRINAELSSRVRDQASATRFSFGA